MKNENAHKPVVAISCITYNHVNYIHDALEGFVMQQTTFPFVAYVHDDASCDGTVEIIKEYASKYPDIIIPILESENQYSKRDGSITRIMREKVIESGARYVAHCEGDDYWTDPLKLQKQVDFLEAHPDYSMVFANARYVYEDGRAGLEHQLENREYKPIELYREYISPTPTIMHRTEVYESIAYKNITRNKNMTSGDVALILSCGSIGKIYGSNDLVCDFRRLSTGAHTQFSSHPYSDLRTHIIIAREFGSDFMEFNKVRFFNKFAAALRYPFRNYPENIKFIFRYIWFAPGYAIRKFRKAPRFIFRKLFHATN